MGAALYIVAVLAGEFSLWADETARRQAPTYTAASIVNAASNAAGALAPYTFATIYGTDLSYSTRAIASEDIRSGRLPTELGGVRVNIGNQLAAIYYVSPGQINLLIPTTKVMNWPQVEILIVIDGKVGPAVAMKLLEAAPALFQWGPTTVVATRPDWTHITAAAPARPGDIVILFATGLGETKPPTIWLQAPSGEAPLERMSEFGVILDSALLEREKVLYAGAAPRFAGLYQINLKLPDKLVDDPEIRIAVGGQISPAGLRLPVRAAGPQPGATGTR
jgi:uncharacterized protein (TIGR03437 family)